MGAADRRGRMRTAPHRTSRCRVSVPTNAIHSSTGLTGAEPTDTGHVDDEFTFWHGQGDRWWIERFDEVVFVSSTTDEDVPVARMAGGQLVFQRSSNSIVIGRVLGPKDLCGPRSKLLRSMRGMTKPTEVDVDGRL